MDNHESKLVPVNLDSMEKIFFTGGSGLLALNWAAYCHNKYHVILGMHKRKVNPVFASTVSISEARTESSMERVIRKISPDIVINTAAITNIEHCEYNPEDAYESNVTFAKRVATVCDKLDIPLVHISTDHLFGNHNSYSTEEESFSPVNEYARTKAIAETQVSSRCSKSIIVRTNFFGIGTSYRLSFVDIIIKELASNRPFWGFEDVFFTPLLVSDLADCVHELIKNRNFGVYNVASNYRISKYQFAVLVAQIFGFKESLVKPCKISDQSNLVVRPHDMSLSNVKVTTALMRDLGTAEDGLRRLRAQFNQEICQQIQLL